MQWLNKWNQNQTLSPREKYKGYPKIIYQISQALKNDALLESEIDEALEVLNKCTKILGNDSNTGKLKSQLILQKLKYSGDDQAKIISKLSLNVSVESGTIMIGDPEIKFEFEKFDNQELIQTMNQGKAIIFGTGGDGLFEVQLRLVEAKEPVLTPKEYKLVVGSTDTIVIQVESGKITAGDFGLIEESTKLLELEPGNYKICVYLFDTGKDFAAYYAVLCKTNLEAENNTSDTFYLEMN